MAKWAPCGEDFEIGDVVRWTEGIWHEFKKKPRKGRKRKTLRLGTREVTAQVMTHEPGGFVYFSVMKCAILDVRYSVGVDPYPKNLVIKRKRATIAKCHGERLVTKAEAAPPAPKRTLSRFQR